MNQKTIKSADSRPKFTWLLLQNESTGNKRSVQFRRHFNHHTRSSKMKFSTIASATALMLGALTAAHAYDPKATIADLDARLTKIGAAKISGTDTAADKTVPALFFGERKINNNYDVVDAIRTRPPPPSSSKKVKNLFVSAPTCSRLKASAAPAPRWRATRLTRRCRRASSSAAP
jgi:hypothetical protein